jgi:hypothetical protein
MFAHARPHRRRILLGTAAALATLTLLGTLSAAQAAPSTPKLAPHGAQAKLHAPKRADEFKRAHPLPKAKPTAPLARASGTSVSCSGGRCDSCATWGNGCWPMLDNYVSAYAGWAAGGQNPVTMTLFGSQPDIYQRNGRDSQYVALRYGLEYKGVVDVRWADWWYARVFTDSTPSTNITTFWNARDSRIWAPDLGFNTDAFYGQQGLPTRHAYRLRLQVVWYNDSSPGGIQANNAYVVPFNGYGTNWNQWLYWTGCCNNLGYGIYSIGP